MVKRVGIIGLSPGNGHPFSFSAIINGYNPDVALWKDWRGILNYLNKQSKHDIGFKLMKVTHLWTQDPQISQDLSRAAMIENVCTDYLEMVNEVDAVILARDDYELHFEMAKPFLEAGKKVFIDKPLTINQNELKLFAEYLRDHKLMSCSGLRYARELDEVRANLIEFGEIRSVQCSIINDWEKYGIHMVESILSALKTKVVSVNCVSGTSVYVLNTVDGYPIVVNCLGEGCVAFQVDIWGTKNDFHVSIRDNFSAFRRTMISFENFVQSESLDYPFDETVEIIKVIIAGKMSRKENRKVELHEIKI
jgi:hypothetical protein